MVGVEGELGNDFVVGLEGYSALALVVGQWLARVVGVLTIEVAGGRLEAQAKVHLFRPIRVLSIAVARLFPGELRDADVHHRAPLRDHLLVVLERRSIEVDVVSARTCGDCREAKRVTRTIREKRIPI